MITKFKETEIGLIPEDWEVKTLKNLLKGNGYIRGPFGSALRRNELKSGGIPVYEQQHAIDNHRDFRYFINEEKFKELSRFTVKERDLIISCSGNVGKISLIKKDDPKGIISQALLILRPNYKNIIPEYLKYFFSSKLGYESLMSRSGGSVQVNLAKKQIIQEIKIPTPSIKEQVEIIKVLSSIDEKIHLNNEMNRTLEAIGHAIFRHWFVHFEFPNSEEQPYKSSGGEMMDSELGEIPVGWEVGKLCDVCDITMGQSPKSEFYNEKGEGLPFHQGVTNFGERFPNDKMYCTVENKIAEHGDILFSVRAPVGRINIAKSKMVIGRGLSSIRHKNGLQSFLLYQLKNIFTEEDSIGSGTVFNAITRKDLDDLNVIVPNKEVDKQFNDFVSPMEKQIENLVLEGDELVQIRDSLLPKLMSGKIRL